MSLHRARSERNTDRPGGAARPGRVLCVVRWPVGGIRTYLLYNYPHLVDAGFRFTLLGPGDDSFWSLREEVAGWDQVDFVEAPIGKGRECQMWRLVRQQLRTGRFALVHAQGYTAALQSLLGGIGIPVPQVVTIHDVIREAQVRGPAGALKQAVLGRALGRASAIIAVTTDVRDNLLSYWPFLRSSRCELVTIPHGIDLRRIADAGGAAAGPGDLRRQLGLGEGVVLLGFLGRFMEQKGFLPLLDALDQLRQDPPDRPYQLVAVGSGDYVREYRREVERRGLGGIVSFRDAVPNVAPVLRQLDLLVMPSLWEAAGLLAMEAMALGIPVLGSDCIGLREVLRDTPSLTFPAGDVGALSRLLKQAILCPRAEQARSFAVKARHRFDAECSARSLLAVFERIGDR